MNSRKLISLRRIGVLFTFSVMAAGMQSAFAGGDYVETAADDDCVVKKLVRHPGPPGNRKIIKIERLPCPEAEFSAFEAQEEEPLAKPRTIQPGTSRGLRPPYRR